MRLAAAALLWLAATGSHACNPSPALPPVLEGYAYDATAAGVLIRDAGSVVTARFRSTVELLLGNDGVSTTYVFEVIEGWKAVQPRRLAIEDVWVPCDLELRKGAVFLLYMDGDRLLYAVPAADLDTELALLGDVAWFYGPSGQLVRPVEQE